MPPEIKPRPKPKASIVVCTYNRADDLAPAVESLLSLETPPELTFEVLVVDNNSKDHTAEVVARIARENRRKDVAVRRVFEPQQGVVAARNRGVREAMGDWIAFFDDDQLADPAWLTDLYATAIEYDVRAVGGAVRLKLPEGWGGELAPFCRMLLSETVGRDEPQWYDLSFSPGCGNLMVAREVFDEIGMFRLTSETGRGEDSDLFRRMLAAGYRVRYTPTAIIDHVIPAERLTAEFFLKASEKMGDALCTDELREYGLAWTIALWLGRTARAWLLHRPLWLWHQSRGDEASALGIHSRLALLDAFQARLSQEGWASASAPVPESTPASSPSS